MLRIAVIQRFLPSRSRGGVGYFTHGLCNALEQRGHSVTVFSQDPAPEDALYRVQIVPSNQNGTRRRVDPLLFPFQIARQDFSKFDVLHAQGDDQLVPRHNSPPVVRTMHGSAWAEAIHNGWRAGSAKRFLLHTYFYVCEFVASLRADRTVAVSHDTRRYYPKIHRVIPNGVAIGSFAYRGEERSQRPSLLFVGDLDSRKRGRLLIEVFRQRVKPVVPDAELWLVCPEPVKEEGVLCFHSVDDEQLADLYRSAWVFCLPSSYEGFGRPYVEAMAAGATVVATPNPGAGEVLDNGRYGLIVPVQDLGDALCTLLRRPDLRRQYAQRAAERAKHYSWDRVAQEYERVYETVLPSSSRGLLFPNERIRLTASRRRARLELATTAHDAHASGSRFNEAGLTAELELGLKQATPLGLPQWLAGFCTTCAELSSAIMSSAKAIKPPAQGRWRVARSLVSGLGKRPPLDNRRGVAYLQSTSEIGGSDVALLGIVESLDKTRFRAVVLVPSDGPLVQKLRERGSEVFIVKEMLKLTTRRGTLYLLRYCLNYPRAIQTILRLLRRHRVELVHTNSLHNLYGFLAASLAGLPHVWHVREIVLQSRFVRRIELFLARHWAHRVIAISDAVAEMFGNGRDGSPAHLVKIPDGIDLDRFHPRNSGADILRHLNIAPDVPLVGLVARLDHWKGVDTFLHAVAICHQQLPKARFLIAGGTIDGQEQYGPKMQSLADNLGLEGIVHFAHWRYQPDDMPQVHAALSLLVLASSWPEPFGLVLLEAMATGKPVVATNHGGPREICVDGETAILVPPRDPPRMAEAILTILRDPDRARRMGVAARQRVEQLFDTNRSVKQLERLYEELMP